MQSLDAMRSSDAPFIAANHLGVVESINDAFTIVYGWTMDDLADCLVTKILPEAYRDSHHLGFSRFQSTNKSEVLGHPLRLETLCKDGRSIISEHLIVAEQSESGWVFGATLTPLPDETATDA